MGIRVNEVRVHAIVFDYPRYLGATDEGMSHGSSILAYLVFGPGRVFTEGIARPISMIAWCSLEERPGVQCKTRRDLVKLGLV
jgi:hypothetical protein